MLKIVSAAAFVLTFSASAFAQDNPGCDSLQTALGATKLELMSTDSSGDSDIGEVMAEMRAAYRALCGIGTPQKGSTVRYPNGRTATNYARTAGATWYYSNGRTITNYAGQAGATWYYSNGRTITNYMDQAGATWYYSNGRTATNYFGQKGATWYYANGRTLTNYAGQRGATWYWPNGRTLSNYMGQAGATWYYENGNTWMNNGPELTEEELLDVPALMLRLRSEDI
jgi:hypothetical protein